MEIAISGVEMRIAVHTFLCSLFIPTPPCPHHSLPTPAPTLPTPSSHASFSPPSCSFSCLYVCRDEKEIKRLVKEGADVNYPDCDMLSFSTMHMAVNTKQRKSLQVLHDIGGNVHIKDGLGWTLMHQVFFVGWGGWPVCVRTSMKAAQLRLSMR